MFLAIVTNSSVILMTTCTLTQRITQDKKMWIHTVVCMQNSAFVHLCGVGESWIKLYMYMYASIDRRELVSDRVTKIFQL